MKRERIIVAVTIALMLTFLVPVFGQQHRENGADQVLRGSGRVNASTLGMEIDIPLGAYPGRGINVPVSLSYSSKVWRLDYSTSEPVGLADSCVSMNIPKYSDNSAAGWTTSMAVPYIEYTGADNLFQDDGYPLNFDSDACTPNSPPNYSNNAYIRKITVHLPSGETHELRIDDTVMDYPKYSNCVDEDPNTPCDGNDPSLPENWYGWYYATDGSNIKYFEDRTNDVYFLQMPDGSKYEFVKAISWLDEASIRKAYKFIDRNGNYTTYNGPTTTYPNGYWTDTLGKIIAVPFGLTAPVVPTAAGFPQEYAMPGMTGKYKFHWKKLKDTTEAESALTDYNQTLKYTADRASSAPNQSPRTDSYLFSSGSTAWVIDSSPTPFNPVVLKEIELPTGQKYKFTYDVYGRIERIYYPTGGEERFVYGLVGQLSHNMPGDINEQTNFGVTNRKLYTTAGTGTPLEWIYSTEPVTPNGLKVSITAPDNTKVERYLHRSINTIGVPTFGYNTNLAGMPYEERAYNSATQIVSKKLTTWEQTNLSTSGGLITASASWHPRVSQQESIIYEAGNGISTTTKYYYETGLSSRESPLLQNKVEQYGFVVAGSSLPTLPIRSSETTYLQADSNYPQWVKDIYQAQNMIGLTTASQVKDSAGTVVSRSEMKYDDGGYSPEIGRGNPTTSRVWDSTKGVVTNSNAYIQTQAKFDTYGNQYESIDAKGNTTTTTFDSTYHAYPIQVTSAIPDPTNQHGSNTAFVSSATFNPITGLPLSTTDANGLITRIEYDEATLRPLNTKNYVLVGGTEVQVGGTSETVYHDEPNNYWVKNRTQIDETDWAENILYFDGLGRSFKTEKLDSQGNIYVEKEFDADGRPRRVTNPYRTGETKVWTATNYDEQGRVKEVITESDNAKITTNYGVSTSGIIGTTVTVTDQAGKLKRSITNALGQLVRIDEPTTSGLGSISSPNQPTYYKYNILGKMIEVTQGIQQRHFLYDSLGRLLRVRQPEQQVNSALNLSNPETSNTQWSVGFTYDNNGNILTTTDAKNITTTFTYDAINRIKTKSYSNNLTPSINYYHDGSNVSNSKGKLTKVATSISETLYTAFDNMGRLSASEQTTDGQTYSSSYKYNLAGILTEQTYPSGRIVKNFIDGNGDTSAISSKLSNSPFKMYAANFGYTPSKVIKHLQLGNGIWESAVMNSREQVTELKMGNSPTDGSLWKLTYAYGEFDAYGNVDTTKNSGNIAKQTVTASGLAQPFVQTYKYDNLNRITEAKEMNNGNQTWQQTFDYDRYGNRNAFTQDIGGQQLAINNLTLPQIDANTNRFVSAQGYNYGYDANGNLTTDAEGRQFTFDGDNKQTEVKNSANIVVGRYFYDGNGKRVKKIEFDQYGVEKEITTFVYDGLGKLAAEYSTAAPVSNPTTNYTATDPLGSPRVITNKQGQIISRRDFMPFGEQLPTDATYRTAALKYDADDKIRQKFTGYQRDEETGLDFAEARYYNNKHGRFTAVDPLLASGKSANPQTFNRYVYVMNQPLSYTDPTGLQAGGGPPRGSINLPSNLVAPTRDDRGPITGPGVSDTQRNILSERFRVEVSNSSYNEISALNGTNLVAGRGTLLTISVINEETGDLVRSMDFQPTSSGTVLPDRAVDTPQDGFTTSGGIIILPLCNVQCSVVRNNVNDNKAPTPIDPSLENDVNDVLNTETETTVKLRISESLDDEMEVRVVTGFVRDENNPNGVKVVQIGEATITTTKKPPELKP